MPSNGDGGSLGVRIMRNPVRAFLPLIGPLVGPMVVVGTMLAGCSSPQTPGDDFNLSVHNPTPAALARTGPTAEPGEDQYNRTIPLP